MKKLVFITTLYQYDHTKQVVYPDSKTATIYSRKHPRKGTQVITRFFIEALRQYAYTQSLIAKRHGRKPTNYIDVDNVLSIYHGIMQHEEELLLDLMLK
jgi:hypothetical protein